MPVAVKHPYAILTGLLFLATGALNAHAITVGYNFNLGGLIGGGADLPGISSGTLTGMFFADDAALGDDVIDHYTYSLVGDGCLQEGIGQEIIALAGHLKLNKLVFLWDDNKMTDDGPTHQAISEDVRARNGQYHQQETETKYHRAISLSAATKRILNGTLGLDPNWLSDPSLAGLAGRNH